MIGVRKGGLAGCDGWVLIMYQPFSPLGQRFELAPCPLGRLNLPHSRKCILLLNQKLVLGAFVSIYRCGLRVSFCLHLSGVDVSPLACQWMKYPIEYWELLSRQCRGRRRKEFLSSYVWAVLRCMCLSILLQTLAEAPAISQALTVRLSAFTPVSPTVVFSLIALLLTCIEIIIFIVFWMSP